MKFLLKGAFIGLTILYTQLTYAQYIFKGKVVDETTQQPIEYAGIKSNIPSKSTITDRFGNFQLSLPADTATLHITYMGYSAKQISVTANAKRSIVTLNRGPISLTEVQISPGLNNTSFHTLSTLDLNLRPVNSSQDLMRLVPGLLLPSTWAVAKLNRYLSAGLMLIMVRT